MDFSRNLLTSSESGCLDSLSTECSLIMHNMYDLQSAIIKQATDIENFIKRHDNSSGKSKSFLLLQTLFETFKTEVSLNIKLRQELIEERSRSQEIISKIEQMDKNQRKFFKSLSKNCNCSLKSFDQISNYIFSLQNDQRLAKDYSQTIKVITSQNQDKEAQLSLEIAHLNSRVETLENEKQQILNKLQYTNTYVQSKDQNIQQLQKSLSDLENKYKESEEKRLKSESLLRKAENVLKVATKKAKQFQSERDKMLNYVQTLEILEKKYAGLTKITGNNQAVQVETIKKEKKIEGEELFDADGLLDCLNSLRGDIDCLKDEVDQINYID